MTEPNPQENAGKPSARLSGSARAKRMLQRDWLQMHKENKALRACLDQMRQLVWEHHSATIMSELIATCPVCVCKRWSDLLDQAAKLTAPITKGQAPPDPSEL